MGARPLGRKIDEIIRVPLSKKILFERLSNCTVNVDIQDGTAVFVVEPAVQPGVNHDGIIVVNNQN